MSRSSIVEALSEAQHEALMKLRANGGEGVIDRHGKLVASGVRLLGFEPITWLRLMTTGHLEVRGPLRIGLTAFGDAAAAQAPPMRVNPHGIHGRTEPTPAHPGAE